MPTPTRLAIIFIALLATLPLHAGVVEHDFLTLGDGLLTYDDVNQREWLDLSYAYTSLDNIKSKMVPGEFLDGFKFATEEDVRNLNLSAGPSEYRESGVDDLIDSLGFIFRATGGVLGILEFTLGQVAVGFDNGQPIFDDTNVVLQNIGKVLQPGNSHNPLFFNGLGRDLVVANAAVYEGVSASLPNNAFVGYLSTNDTGPFWLYRNAVPEPTSIVLLTIATFTALSTRNRRR